MNKKKLALLLALVLCLPLLSGCHGAQESGEFAMPSSFDESKQYEISFWAKNDTNQTQVDIYKNTISEFEKLYPNIKVNLRLYTDYGRLYSDVITNIATDTTPNVCITYPDHIATYLTGKNSVVPLEELMAHEKYGLGGTELRFDGPSKAEIIPQFLSECLINGITYALPYMRSTEACYVNKTYVEKLGYTLPETLTWDFVWEVSDAAAQKDEEGVYLVNGQKVMIPFLYKSTDNMMIQLLRQMDAEYSTENGQILVFNDTVHSQLLNIAEHVKKGAFSTFKISGYPANYLNAGQCIFAVDSTAGATWMGSDAPLIDIPEDQLVEFETVVMPIPQYDPENPQMISQGPSVCIFQKDDPQVVMASWLFTQFLLTNKVQIDYSCTEGYVPVTSKALNSPEYQDYLSREGEDNQHYYEVKIQAAKLLLDNVENTFVTPVFNGSASLRDAAGQMIEEVTKGIRRKKTVDDAFIEKLYGDMVSRYHLNPEEVGSANTAVKKNFGPLPGTSVILLSALGIAWALIIVYVIYNAAKKRKVANSLKKD
ncbi:MAG: extracellular solute-binding protein [Clostridiales bacterium]|nr:extracellular solute-binding protein [Clostridiales bacterium]